MNQQVHSPPEGNDNQFFMRFYDSTEDQVREFIDRYSEAVNPGPLVYMISPLKTSVNSMLPPGNHLELTLWFESPKAMTKALGSPAGRALYMEYATSIPGAKFVQRQPGDKAWGHSQNELRDW